MAIDNHIIHATNQYLIHKYLLHASHVLYIVLATETTVLKNG